MTAAEAFQAASGLADTDLKSIWEFRPTRRGTGTEIDCGEIALPAQPAEGHERSYRVNEG